MRKATEEKNHIYFNYMKNEFVFWTARVKELNQQHEYYTVDHNGTPYLTCRYIKLTYIGEL